MGVFKFAKFTRVRLVVGWSCQLPNWNMNLAAGEVIGIAGSAERPIAGVSSVSTKFQLGWWRYKIQFKFSTLIKYKLSTTYLPKCLAIVPSMHWFANNGLAAYGGHMMIRETTRFARIIVYFEVERKSSANNQLLTSLIQVLIRDVRASSTSFSVCTVVHKLYGTKSLSLPSNQLHRKSTHF